MRKKRVNVYKTGRCHANPSVYFAEAIYRNRSERVGVVLGYGATEWEAIRQAVRSAENDMPEPTRY